MVIRPQGTIFETWRAHCHSNHHSANGFDDMLQQPSHVISKLHNDPRKYICEIQDLSQRGKNIRVNLEDTILRYLLVFGHHQNTPQHGTNINFGNTYTANVSDRYHTIITLSFIHSLKLSSYWTRLVDTKFIHVKLYSDCFTPVLLLLCLLMYWQICQGQSSVDMQYRYGSAEVLIQFHLAGWEKINDI